MEETVRMVQSAAQAGVEITAELAKLLLPALAKGGVKLLGAEGKLIGYALDKISDAQAEGTVSRKHLFAEAAKEKSEVRTTDNFPRDVTDRLVEKAKENHIPVSVNGEGENRSISYLDRDSEIVGQIMREWQEERISPKNTELVSSVKQIAVNDERNIDLVKSRLEKNGVDCWFTKTQNGEVRCNFKADDLAKVGIITDEIKKMQNGLEENFKINADIPENDRQLEIKAQIAELKETSESLRLGAELEETPEARDAALAEIAEEIDGYEAQINELQNEYDAERVKVFETLENKKVTLSDERSEKSFEVDINSETRKSDITVKLQSEFDYTPEQAELAANKLADELGLGGDYYKAPAQGLADIEKMQINIRYPSDDSLLADTSFSALKLKDVDDVQLNVTLGDSAVLVSPAALSDDELKKIFKERLGMNELQAEKAVSKSRKIDAQINSRLRETVFKQEGQQHTVNIERHAENTFSVKHGDKVKTYNFTTINLEEKIAEDFGIPAKNAHNVVTKAQGQSVIQNKIRENSENKRKAAKAKNDPFKSQSTSTNSKKVSR